MKKFFKPGEDPIGQHFGANDIKNAGDFEIVGVVEDTKYQSTRDLPDPMYFTPMLQESPKSRRMTWMRRCMRDSLCCR